MTDLQVRAPGDQPVSRRQAVAAARLQRQRGARRQVPQRLPLQGRLRPHPLR